MKFYLLPILLLLSLTSIFANDDYFEFLEQYLPEKVEYEKSRKLCLFPFRNKNEQEKFQYLSNGIPSVIISNLNGFKYVYDSDVLENVVYHSFGEPKNQNATKTSKSPINRETLKELNSGAKEVLPEKDPRYIKLDVGLIAMDKPPLFEANLELGRKNKCFYVITGEYITNESDRLVINLEFTYRKNGKVERLSETTSLRRAYQEMDGLGIKIKKMLFNKEMTTIQVETGEETDALVFIDGHYAGKTPLEKSDVATGRHAISITKEGFEKIDRVVNLKKGSVSKYSFSLVKLEKKGLLSVKSNPSGASVYLGLTYLGETPLKDVSVPLGQNRIRIEKEDHIDYYSGVEIEAGKTFSVNANLKEGKTEDYYKNRLKLFLDYTYFDFSQYSIYSVVLFYASYQYWNYRVNDHKDSIRGLLYSDASGSSLQGQVLGELSLLTIYQTYYSADNETARLGFVSFVASQRRIVDENEKKSNELRSYRDASAVGAVSMLALAGVFYYLGVNSDAFEFAISPPIQSVNPIAPVSFESYAKFNFRF